jgi:hypothetical protein
VVRDPRGTEDLETDWGAWIWSEWRLGRRWLAGARYEWVRVRFEWDHLDDPSGTVNAFLLQFTFAMGPHKHETY